VDIEGADLIIQRRVTAKTILDLEPARLGFVQVKYFQDEATSQYIHYEYPVDPRGMPRTEFFVICHTGTEDNQRMFFLTAEMIVSDFKRVEPGVKQAGKFRLPGKDILGSKRYEIVKFSLVLDRIDRALRNADILANRRFLSWALPFVPDINPAIRPIYEESLHNHWGNIPEAFEVLKEKARSEMWHVEEFVSLIREIIATDDPEVALKATETLRFHHGYQFSIRPDLHDEYFQKVVDEHKVRIKNLQEAGLLDSYLKFQSEASRAIIDYLAPQMPLPKETSVCVITATYDPATFLMKSIELALVSKDNPLVADKEIEKHYYDDVVVSSEAGRIVVKYEPPASGYRIYGKQGIRNVDDFAWPEKLQTAISSATNPLMEELYRIRFLPPDHVAW
jgi:hypothetical protein